MEMNFELLSNRIGTWRLLYLAFSMGNCRKSIQVYLSSRQLAL
jgi:hypothetical protein